MSEPDRRLNAYREDWADLRLKGRIDAARFVEGRGAGIRIAIADLRRRPASDAPLETQGLFGASLRVFETNEEGWSFVQLDEDRYVGWMESEAIGPLASGPNSRVAVPRTLVFPGPDIKRPPIGALPMGALVTATGEASDTNAHYRLVEPFGAVVAQHLEPLEARASDFVTVAERLVGAPYLWGGKSALGIDCSGLTQLAFEMAGVQAPRDSDMQEGWAREVDADAPRRRGDLVFWKGHVGVMLDETRLLHANVHHMMTAVEPLSEASARIGAKGSSITSIRRAPGPVS